jgi:hypothetical protein
MRQVKPDRHDHIAIENSEKIGGISKTAQAKSAKSTNFVYAPQMSPRQGRFALFFFRREFARKQAR